MLEGAPAIAEEDVPSGDELAAELERYLQGDHGGDHGGEPGEQ